MGSTPFYNNRSRPHQQWQLSSCSTVMDKRGPIIKIKQCFIFWHKLAHNSKVFFRGVLLEEEEKGRYRQYPTKVAACGKEAPFKSGCNELYIPCTL